LDTVGASAVDLARAAAVEEAGLADRVGSYLGADAEDERVVVHRFVCADPAYRGWNWCVEVSRASRSKAVTVDDVVLLPGEGSLLAPPWVPWSQRLRPGDVGVGDLLPTAADDPRLILGQGDTDGWVDTEAWLELGLGRVRVLSAEGRLDAAERWQAGEGGPEDPVAKAAPARCGTCGFYVHLVGVLGQALGVCANELAPSDGRVVTADHGCGAHSEALVLPSAHPSAVTFDDGDLDITASPGHTPGSVDAAEAGEPYGHS
jgi:hypothetical protein